jgi:hypothetical protein
VTRHAPSIVATLVAVALTVGACTGHGLPAPTAAGSPSLSPIATAAVAQTDPPSSARVLPDGWTNARTEDGAIAYGLPPDWEQGSVAEMRDGVAADIASGQLTGEYLAGSTWFLKLLDSGAVRGVMSGPSQVEGYTVSILYTILPAPTDLRSGAEAAIRDAPHPPSQHRSPLAPPTLPIGDALVATLASDSTGGAPSRGVLTFTLLRDGRLLWLDGAAALADDGFDALVAEVAASISEP